MPEGSKGFLVTLAGEIGDQDIDAVAAAIRDVPGVATVRRYTADPGDLEAMERNDARWRESIVHLLDDEGV